MSNCSCDKPEEMIFHDPANGTREVICGHCDQHIRFLPKDTDECDCEQPDKHVDSISHGRGGHTGSNRYHLSCLKCMKKIKTLDDYQLDALNEDNPAHACEKCGKKLSWLKFRIIGNNRTFIGEDIVQLMGDYHLLCDNCVTTIEHIVIPRYIQCDLCHKPHEREFYADDQGRGLCGYVKHNYKYPARIGFRPVGECKVLDGYIIDCEYGSCYDACGSPCEFIKFAGDQLPDTIHLGMNICDECITNLIHTGVCIDPSRDNPHIKDDFVAIPPECIHTRPSLPPL
jgi:hypothetical protein